MKKNSKKLKVEDIEVSKKNNNGSDKGEKEDNFKG